MFRTIEGKRCKFLETRYEPTELTRQCEVNIVLLDLAISQNKAPYMRSIYEKEKQRTLEIMASSYKMSWVFIPVDDLQ
jgi:hypothetical protein